MQLERLELIQGWWATVDYQDGNEQDHKDKEQEAGCFGRYGGHSTEAAKGCHDGQQQKQDRPTEYREVP
jgi:hypothetical protein